MATFRNKTDLRKGGKIYYATEGDVYELDIEQINILNNDYIEVIAYNTYPHEVIFVNSASTHESICREYFTTEKGAKQEHTFKARDFRHKMMGYHAEMFMNYLNLKFGKEK